MTRSWHSSEQRAQPARQEREAVWTPASGAEGRAAVVSTAPGAGAGVGAPLGLAPDLAPGLQPTLPEPPGSDLRMPWDQGKPRGERPSRV